MSSGPLSAVLKIAAGVLAVLKQTLKAAAALPDSTRLHIPALRAPTAALLRLKYITNMTDIQPSICAPQAVHSPSIRHISAADSVLENCHKYAALVSFWQMGETAFFSRKGGHTIPMPKRSD